MTVGEVIATARDASFVIGLSVLGWKARDLIQPVYDFFTHANDHMSKVETGMETMSAGMTLLLNNHMAHVQSSLETLTQDSRSAKNEIVRRDKRRDDKKRKR